MDTHTDPYLEHLRKEVMMAERQARTAEALLLKAKERLELRRQLLREHLDTHAPAQSS